MMPTKKGSSLKFKEAILPIDPFSASTNPSPECSGQASELRQEDSWLPSPPSTAIQGSPKHDFSASILEVEDVPVLDVEKLRHHGRRLKKAIDAEHVHQFRQYLDGLGEDGRRLEAKGELVFGVTIQALSDHRISVTRSDDGSFRQAFRLNDPVSIFRDVNFVGDDDVASQLSDGSCDCEAVVACHIRLPTNSQQDDTDPSPSGKGNCILASKPSAPQDCTSSALDGYSDGEESDGSGDSDDDDDSGNGDDDDGAPGARQTSAIPGPLPAAPPLDLPWEFRNTASTELRCGEASALNWELKRRQEEMGIVPVFDGWVSEAADKEMIVRTRTRNDKAHETLQNGSQAPKWVLAPALQDSTFRRQAAAVEGLAVTLSDVPDPSAPRRRQLLQRRRDEVRMRQLLLCNPDDKADAAFAQLASGEGVQWLDDRALAELDHVLCGNGANGVCGTRGLNAEQLDVLRHAAKRSLTLIQGPPGTGKTYTLAAMAAALCRVFHNPQPVGASQQDHPFELPCSKRMEDWTEKEVARWIQSFQNEALKQAALRISDGHSGRAVEKYKFNTLTHRFKDDAPGGSSSEANTDNAVAADVARRHAAEFVALRDATLAAIEQFMRGEGPCPSGFWRTVGRDLRMIVCADTNTAANRLLEHIVSMLPEASTHQILRLGIMKEGEEGSDLSNKYHLDRRLDEHLVVKVRERLRTAMKRKQLTKELARDLTVALGEYCKQKTLDAAKSDRALLRIKWTELAEAVREVVAPEVNIRIRKFLDSRPMRSSKNLDPCHPLKELLKTLRRIAEYDILVSVQVVVGTNSSIGELRGMCEEHCLPFPILLMDEAGQASEPSSLIPFSLGVEWALLGGDMKQLPPTILTGEAKRALGFSSPIGGSQYGRFAQLGVLELRLNRQYRMNPFIREFPSRHFYGNTLSEDPERMPDTTVPQPGKYEPGVFTWPSEKNGRGTYPIAFFDVPHSTESRLGTSYFNEGEAALALQLMLAMGRDPSVLTITILTPYKGQAKYIKKRLESGRSALRQLRDSGKLFAEKCTAHTVDGFQGHEADVVIISTVRSNEGGWVGHLADCRRLNVAITRARRALLIVGNLSTLRLSHRSTNVPPSGKPCTDNFWPALISHIERRGDAVVEGSAVHKFMPCLPALPKDMACDPRGSQTVGTPTTATVWRHIEEKVKRRGQQQQKQ